MTDKEIINEFTNLYNDFGSVDMALHQIKEIISRAEYSRLIDGLTRLRK